MTDQPYDIDKLVAGAEAALVKPAITRGPMPPVKGVILTDAESRHHANCSPEAIIALARDYKAALEQLAALHRDYETLRQMKDEKNTEIIDLCEQLAAAQAKLDAIEGLAEKWRTSKPYDHVPPEDGNALEYVAETLRDCATDLQRITNKEKA